MPLATAENLLHARPMASDTLLHSAIYHFLHNSTYMNASHPKTFIQDQRLILTLVSKNVL